MEYTSLDGELNIETKKMNKGYESLDEEFNIETKKMYHKWFNKYIKDGKEAFENAVIAMGKTYNVLRTLPKQEENESQDDNKTDDSENELNENIREKFFRDIWDNIKVIQTGEYKWSKTIENRHFYSYLSKVCYLIKPEKYKIIYDTNNEKRLKELYPERTWNPNNWQKNIDEIFDDLVNKYQVELKKYKDGSPEYYFCLDFLLWKKN